MRFCNNPFMPKLNYGSLPRWGPRFPAINNAYDLKLRKLTREVAKGLGLSEFMQEGVYAMVGGPNYETVAELRALRTLGADAVGKT